MKALAIIIMGSLICPMLAAGERPSVAPVFSLNQEQEPPARAERYLSDLADASRRARRLGYVFVGLGAAAVVGGLVVLGGIEDSDDFEDFFETLGAIGLLSLGGSSIIVGTVNLLVASGPERRYTAVKAISNALEREQASRDALASLSRSGRTQRIVSGVIFSALAVYAAASTGELQSALGPGAMAAYQFFRKSREERTYASFLSSEEVPPDGLRVGFGPGPRGGFRMVLSASF